MNTLRIFTTTIAAAAMMTSSAFAMSCSDGKTIKEGELTIATGLPAYSPWVYDDNPESGEGFEAAFAWEVSRRMGFEENAVTWIRTSFDEAIQPGGKSFDFNIQQFTIRPERAAVVDFSIPYYTAAKALVVRGDVAERLDGDVSADIIRGLKFGAASGQTSAIFIEQLVQPVADVLLYGDLSDVQAAMQASQVEATVFDVPTALFVTNVRYTDGVIIGEFVDDLDEGVDQYGLLLSKGNPLLECVNDAVTSMIEDGSLDELETKWMNDAVGIPEIGLRD